LQGEEGRFAVKVPSLIETVEDVANLPIVAGPNAVVRARDLATIRSTFKDAETITRLDGKPAIAIEVSKRTGANLVETVDAVKKVADAFAERLVAKTRAVQYGDPMDPATDMGTVIDEEAAIRIEERVTDALGRGARLLCGHERRGALYAPTVVDGVPREAPLVMEETFGPVSPILRFRDIDDAIRLSNSTSYGLSSGVVTNRLDYITRFVQELNVGTVNVREVPGYRIESSPFGGIKDSGLGYKEGVLEAMKAFTNVKTYSLPWG